MDKFDDFFGDGQHCVNCGDDFSGDGYCRACKSGNAAERQLAYLERIGDVQGAENVRLSIAEDAVENSQAEAAYQRVLSNTASNADARLLVKMGWAQNEYNDPESNRPSGIVITRDAATGDPYADQAGLEERAPNHRL